MKKLLTMLVILFSTFTFFGQELDATINKLPVYGLITQSGKSAKNVDVSIYKGNEVMEQFKVKRGEFEVMLSLGHHYTIEVSSEGYITKRLSLDTRVEKKNIKPVPFDCGIDLIPVSLMSGKSTEMLDFPIACVSYDIKKRSFEPNMDYSMAMMRIYGDLLTDK